MRVQIFFLIVFVILMSFVISTLGFSTAQVLSSMGEEQSEVLSATSESTELLLEAGDTKTVINNSEGEIELNLRDTVAEDPDSVGLNPNSRIEIGDAENPAENPAFTAKTEPGTDMYLNVEVTVENGRTPGDFALVTENRKTMIIEGSRSGSKSRMTIPIDNSDGVTSFAVVLETGNSGEEMYDVSTEFELVDLTE